MSNKSKNNGKAMRTNVSLAGVVDFEALKTARHITKTIEKDMSNGKTLAAQGKVIMADTKVQEWKEAVSISRKLGPQLAQIAAVASRGDISKLSGKVTPELQTAVDKFMEAERKLHDPVFAAEAKAMLAKADQLFNDARAARDAGLNLATQNHIVLEGGVA